nr:hypothetical protein [uncultured Pseudomonas sp.]
MNTELANNISSFEPADGNWLPLEYLLEEAFQSSAPEKYYQAIFNLFERFPEEDGSGVFWSALHGMEAVGSYEEKLVQNFRRFPTDMTRAMLVRLRNSGNTHVAGVSLALLIGAK